MEQISNREEYIKSIFEQNFKFTNPIQSITQANLLDSLSFDIYTDAMRFLIEILQNVDDSSFGFDQGNLNMKICISKQMLLISHKGKGFDEADIKSLCSAGDSTKRENSKATGYKGIGFKSVFAVSDKVLIMSNGYNFKFDKKHFTKERCWQCDDWGDSSLHPDYTKIKKPWQIIPINFSPDVEITEKSLLSLTKIYNVNFLFFIKSKIILEDIRKALITFFQKNPMNIVFLKSNNITIRFQEDMQEKIILEKEEVSKSIFNIISNGKLIKTFFNQHFLLKTEELIDKKSREIISVDETFPKKLKEASTIEISFSVPLQKFQNIYEIGNLEDADKVIYSYLPTIENFNFPFLLNSNFILDAGRIKLKQHIWNSSIFKHLPKFFLQLCDVLVENFGNSYEKILLNIDNIPETYEYFFNEMKPLLIKAIKFHEVKVRTKLKYIKPLKNCFIEEFKYDGISITFTKISQLFEYIYGINSLKILKEYYMNNPHNFDFSDEFEICIKEKHEAENIKKYFNSRYEIICKEDFFNFLKTEIYKKYADENIISRILKESINYIKELKECDIIYDDQRKFYSTNNLYIKIEEAESKNNIEVTQIVIGGKKGKKGKNSPPLIKNKVANLIVQKFKENTDIALLQSIGIEISDERNLEYFLKNFQNEYKEETSIKKVQQAFEFWNLTSDYSSKNDIIKNLKLVKFVSSNNNFLFYPSLNIGQFYHENKNQTNFDKNYSEYSISPLYYIENNAKKTWVEFWEEIGIFYKNSIVEFLEISRDMILELPYFTEEYKIAIEPKLKKNQASIPILIYPTLKNHKPENYNEYSKLLKDITNERSQYENKIFKILEDFFHFFVRHNKVFPTSRRELKPISEIYSSSVGEKFDNCRKETKKFLEKIIDFPLTELEEHFKILNFLKDFNLKDIPEIIKKIVDNSLLFNSSEYKKNLVKLYTHIISKLVESDFFYDGYFLDIDENYKRPHELFYIVNEDLKENLTYVVNKLKLKELLLIEVKNKNKFLAYCKKNGIRIYDEKSMTYFGDNPLEQNFLVEKLIIHSNLINQFRQKKGEPTNSAIPNKLKNLKVFGCPKISMKTEYGDSVPEIPCYYEKDGSNFKIYYLEDKDIYTWKHSTIIYYISLYVCQYINSEMIHPEVISVLLSDNGKAIDMLKNNLKINSKK